MSPTLQRLVGRTPSPLRQQAEQIARTVEALETRAVENERGAAHTLPGTPRHRVASDTARSYRAQARDGRRALTDLANQK